MSRKSFISFSKGCLVLLCILSAYPIASFMWLFQQTGNRAIAFHLWIQNIDNFNHFWNALQGMAITPFDSERLASLGYLLVCFIITNGFLLMIAIGCCVLLVELLSTIAFGAVIIFVAFVDKGVDAALGCAYDIFTKESDR